VLAVSVLHDVDVEPAPLGVVLPGSPRTFVGWGECLAALAGADPETDLGRLRLLRWLQARRWAADAGPDQLRAALVPLGLPVGHALHPGADWVREHVLGGALDLGLGAVGLVPGDPDAVVLLPPPALAAVRVDPARVWPEVRARLDALGAIAADRLRADARGLLRPLGPCDVVTLLGARTLRAAVAGTDGLGAAIVPMRRRGWTRLALVDPAFGPAAAAATQPEERGFARPLLVTVDEVALARDGGDVRRHALQEPAPAPTWPREARLR
jgi:hypothetical protein